MCLTFDVFVSRKSGTEGWVGDSRGVGVRGSRYPDKPVIHDLRINDDPRGESPNFMGVDNRD